MVDERKGPEDGHRIVPDRDELANYQRSRQARSSLAGRFGDVPAVGASGGGGASRWLTLLLVVAVVALLGGLGLVWTQHQQTRDDLASALERVDALEGRLSITDESVTESASSIQVKLKELDFEIRKLWDNVWKRSKARLAEHDSQIEKLQARDKEMQTFVAEARKQLASTEKVVAELSAGLENYTQMQSTVEASAGEIKKIASSVQQLSAKVTQFDSRLAALQKRVAANEEWVESINGFRRQVNQDLLEIKQRIGAL